jgi:hypothetical protein
MRMSDLVNVRCTTHLHDSLSLMRQAARKEFGYDNAERLPTPQRLGNRRIMSEGTQCFVVCDHLTTNGVDSKRRCAVSLHSAEQRSRSVACADSGNR